MSLSSDYLLYNASGVVCQMGEGYLKRPIKKVTKQPKQRKLPMAIRGLTVVNIRNIPITISIKPLNSYLLPSRFVLTTVFFLTCVFIGWPHPGQLTA